MDKTEYYCYDIETFKYAFTLSIVRLDGKHKRTFEVSRFKNELKDIFKCLEYLMDEQLPMIGFNNLGFDYPITHEILKNRKKFNTLSGEEVALEVWKLAQKQIDSFKGEGFGNTVRLADRLIPQLDLYQINHFSNKAKATSLKLLEFNMRMQNIEDLPFAIEKDLTEEEIAKLKSYNEHDVEATRIFALKCKEMIEFRELLTQQYSRDFMNHNDGKVGKDYFIMQLENAGIELYTVDPKTKRKKLRQSPREKIKLKEVLFDYYDFTRPEFQAVKDWFAQQTITELKGVFTDIDESKLGEVAKYAYMEEKRKKFKGIPTEADIARFKLAHPLGWVEEVELKGTETVLIDGVKTKVNKKSHWMVWREAPTLNVVVEGLRYDYGTGGIHASISDKKIKESKGWKLKDADVASKYPNLAISNRVYPEHLGEVFCDIYQDFYNERKKQPKGSVLNLAIKLGLNSVYGDSNNKYSAFYDPKYTCAITINGQLSISLLLDKLLQIDGIRVIQANTDGVTVALKRNKEEEYLKICKQWEEQVKLQLEYADYSTMYLRDVNNYIAVYTDSKVKYKGAYAYSGLGWHQNQSCLVIPKAAEAVMLHGADPEEFIRSCKDPFDFVLRTKVPRSSSLVLRFTDEFNGEVRDEVQQNVCRYYPSTKGGKLIKLMPALEGKEDEGLRELSIDSSYNVRTCNDMKDFSFDDLDYSYYVSEVMKLVISD